MSSNLKKGVYPLPLVLPPSLEMNRSQFEEMIWNAQEKIISFAINHNWDITKDPLIKKIEIFYTKDKFDEAVIKAFHLESDTLIPKKACAVVANDVLLMVSPEVYMEIYPQGFEENYYQKLIIHELAHQLHIRILKGDEDKMGPKWFYEGFAIHVANQFQGIEKQLNKDGIWEIIHTDKDVSYQDYKEVIEYVLEKTNLEDLIENAGEANFVEYVHKNCG